MRRYFKFRVMQRSSNREYRKAFLNHVKGNKVGLFRSTVATWVFSQNRETVKIWEANAGFHENKVIHRLTEIRISYDPCSALGNNIQIFEFLLLVFSWGHKSSPVSGS